MVMNGDYWWKRLDLLEAIDKYGDRLPFSVLAKDIFAYGCPLKKVRDELETRGFVIAEKDKHIVRTGLTAKGKRLVEILSDLKEVWENEN